MEDSIKLVFRVSGNTENKFVKVPRTFAMTVPTIRSALTLGGIESSANKYVIRSDTNDVLVINPSALKAYITAKRIEVPLVPFVDVDTSLIVDALGIAHRLGDFSLDQYLPLIQLVTDETIINAEESIMLDYITEYFTKCFYEEIKCTCGYQSYLKDLAECKKTLTELTGTIFEDNYFDDAGITIKVGDWVTTEYTPKQIFPNEVTDITNDAAASYREWLNLTRQIHVFIQKYIAIRTDNDIKKRREIFRNLVTFSFQKYRDGIIGYAIDNTQTIEYRLSNLCASSIVSDDCELDSNIVAPEKTALEYALSQIKETTTQLASIPIEIRQELIRMYYLGFEGFYFMGIDMMSKIYWKKENFNKNIYPNHDKCKCILEPNFYMGWNAFVSDRPGLAQMLWQHMPRVDLLEYGKITSLHKRFSRMHRIEFDELLEYIDNARPRVVEVDPKEQALIAALKDAQSGTRVGKRGRYIDSSEITVKEAALAKYRAERKQKTNRAKSKSAITESKRFAPSNIESSLKKLKK